MFKNISNKYKVCNSNGKCPLFRISSLIKKKFSNKSSESATKEFEKRVNSVQKVDDDEDYSSIEQYMKVFNEKVYKQNADLTQKLTDIFKDNEVPSGSKIFASVNEINKINLNNSSKLLQVFLNQVLKYNDSVRLFIQTNEKKNSKYKNLVPISVVLLWLCGGIFLYSFYQRNLINHEKVFDNLVKFYNDEAPKTMKINNKFPIFDDHKNFTNLLNFDLYKHIVVIGPSSTGKSESAKHFCLTQAMKDVLSIYVDLNKVTEHDFALMINSLLLENYNGREFSRMNRENFYISENAAKLVQFLSTKTVNFVFDNYVHERDHEKVFLSSMPNITRVSNWRSIIISDNNQVYQNALKEKMEIKYLNFTQTRTFKNYLIEKLNLFAKKKVDYSNLELFSEENVNFLYDNTFFFSYDDLSRYLEANDSIKNYVSSKYSVLRKKIKMLKVKDPQSYDLLKRLVDHSGKKPFDWTNLPANVNAENLQKLENLELIFFKDFSDYILLYSSGIKDILLQ